MLSSIAAFSAHAATVVSFHRIAQGASVTITNPQSTAVSGSIRALAAPGAAEGSRVSFTLQPGESRAFGNVLASTGSALPAAVVAVEASDVVRIDAPSLQPAFAARPAQTTILHDPAGGRTGTLVLGLTGDVQLSVYASERDAAPLVTRTYRSRGAEQTLRLPYAQLLGTTHVPAGVVRVVPLTGTAVVAAENPPRRRHPSDPPAPPTAPLSVTGTACVSQSGLELGTPAGAEAYEWTLHGAVAPSTTTNVVHAVPSAPGYMSIALRTRTGEVNAFGQATVRVDERPSVEALDVSDATRGKAVVIRWTATGAGSGVLTGTDFPAAGIPVDLAAGEYRYTASAIGAKSVRLHAENVCGVSSATETYAVLTPVPSIERFTSDRSMLLFGDSTTLRFTISNAASWRLRSSKMNDTTPATGMGSGSFTSIYSKSVGFGADVVTLEVTGTEGSTASAQLTIADRPRALLSFTFDQQSVPVGGQTTIRVKTSSFAVRWDLRSEAGNAIAPVTGTGEGEFAVTFTRTKSGVLPHCGCADILTVEVLGQDGFTEVASNGISAPEH